jgi:hypothetical protein
MAGVGVVGGVLEFEEHAARAASASEGRKTFERIMDHPFERKRRTIA